MLLKLPDDKQFWNEQVHLSELVIVRANLLKLLLAQGIQETMSNTDNIKSITEQLEKLTGKKVVFAEAEGDEPVDSAVMDNATRFGNAMSLFGALLKQLESAVGVIGAKQEQAPENATLLGQVNAANKGLDQIIKAIESPGAQVAENEEGPTALHQVAELEEEILEVEGEPIQVYFPKGMRKKLKDRAKRAGKFTISDYIRSKVN